MVTFPKVIFPALNPLSVSVLSVRSRPPTGLAGTASKPDMIEEPKFMFPPSSLLPCSVSIKKPCGWLPALTAITTLPLPIKLKSPGSVLEPSLSSKIWLVVVDVVVKPSIKVPALPEPVAEVLIVKSLR